MRRKATKGTQSNKENLGEMLKPGNGVLKVFARPWLS
jgi:hypothetical protein